MKIEEKEVHFILMEYYRCGIAIDKNYVKAFKWHKYESSQEYEQAQYILAKLYTSG